MDNQEFILKRIASLMGVGIYGWTEGQLVSYQEENDNNPLYRNEKLRELLCRGADLQEKPYVYQDKYCVHFACIKKSDKYYMIGPMSLELLNRVELHQFYRIYSIEEKIEKRLKHFKFTGILDLIELVSGIIQGTQYSDMELLYSNQMMEERKKQDEQEQIIFDLKEGEEELYHHTYQEERKLLDSVREGRVEDALRYSRNMDVELGKLSAKELNHWKNVAVVAVTLCTRAAIEGGVPPSVAYRLSDFYIQKSDECHDIAKMIEYRNRAVEELSSRVMKRKQNRSTSNYVEQCKDYIEKHYREKIYQDDIAEMLGISTSYLSKLFHRETGICLQDFVVQKRVEHAANLLVFSNESLAKIAEYVNFPSQSYFGKVFKEQKKMSPRQYRELNKPSSF